jgi:hypothetical protein
MSANLFEKTRKVDLDKATAAYQDAKGNYQRLVRQAIAEPDATKRQDILNAIQSENARLTTVVNGLASEWKQYNTENEEDSPIDLDEEVSKFKEDLEMLRHNRDEVSKLNILYNTLTQGNATSKTTYYGYIVAVLILLVVVFVLFIISYMSTGISSGISSAVEAITPQEMPPIM